MKIVIPFLYILPNSKSEIPIIDTWTKKAVKMSSSWEESGNYFEKTKIFEKHGGWMGTHTCTGGCQTPNCEDVQSSNVDYLVTLQNEKYVFHSLIAHDVAFHRDMISVSDFEILNQFEEETNMDIINNAIYGIFLFPQHNNATKIMISNHNVLNIQRAIRQMHFS